MTRAYAHPQLITIPDEGASIGAEAASPYPAPILGSGRTSGRTQKVSVTRTGLSHTYPTDLDVLVVAPDGPAALVLSDLGGGGTATGATLGFDVR